MPSQVVDPSVSKAKFEVEIARYREIEAEVRPKGWLLLRAEFPQVVVAFAAAHVRPPALVFAVKLDFTNYDLWPPSVQLVNPFTWQPYKAKECPTKLYRGTRQSLPPGLPPEMLTQIPVVATEIVQAHDPEQIPFLCLPGVREYHQHPAHTNDPWIAHRGSGKGTLFAILQTLYRYGVEPLKGFQVVTKIGAMVQGDVPE